MSQFIVKAIKPGGESYEEKVEAPDRLSASRQIKKRGDEAVSVNEVGTGKKFDFDRFLNIFVRIKTHDKITFARNLGTMVDAGLPMTRALGVMEKQTRNNKLKKVLESILEFIGQGKTLSESLAQFPDVFSQLFISMVKAGEESGNISGSLKIVSSQMDKAYALQRKVRGAMMYPAIIITVMIGIGIMMLLFVVPTLSETFVSLNVELPLSTRLIIGVSDFITSYPIAIVSTVLVLAGAFFVVIRSKKGKKTFHFVSLYIPVISGIIKELNSARTTRTLSSLLSSGVDFVVALGITRDVIQNTYYRDVLDFAAKKVEKGEPLSAVFLANEKLYPLFVGEMTSVGEETGKISEMLLSVATFYEEDVDQRTKDMSTIIEPFLMVLIGIAVGFFAVSIIGPIYSLSSAI